MLVETFITISLTPKGSAFSQEKFELHCACRSLSDSDSGTKQRMKSTSGTATAVASAMTSESL